MMKTLRIAIAVVATLLFSGLAFAPEARAQSTYCPAATFGTWNVTPTPGQWYLCLSSLQPALQMPPNSVLGTESNSGTPTNLAMPSSNGVNQALGWATGLGFTVVPIALKGTSASIGGSALTAGHCSSGTVTVTGVTTSMAIDTTPAAYPGDGVYWLAYVSGTNTITVKVCAAASVTPTATTYTLRILQ